MNYAKRFLGEKSTAVIDDNLFNQLFEIGINKSLCIIKSKMPLPKQEPNNAHNHDCFEFTIPLFHNPKLLIEKKAFTLPCKNIFPSNPGQLHRVAEALHQHHIMVCQLDYHYLQGTAFSAFGKNNIEFHNTYAHFDNYLEKTLELFLFESQNRQAGHGFIMDNLSSMITIHLLRILKSNLKLTEKNCPSSNKEINRAVEFLYANYNNEFSLDEVSTVAGMSKYHFIRVFKQETGKTPYQFFIDIKIKKAIEFIKIRKHSITEICFMCGFKSHSHFSRLFFQKMGMSPSCFLKLFQY